MEQQFDVNLIEAVKLNPVIYDRSHYNYKHFVRKAQVWKQISEQLGVSGTFKNHYHSMQMQNTCILVCMYVCISFDFFN